MEARICKECGKSFIPKSSRRQFCYEDHYRVCKGCGKLFFVPSNKLSSPLQVCSEDCRRVVISKSLIYKTPRFDCICKICGKSFKSTSRLSTVCPDKHYRICPICGKSFELPYPEKLTCSKECADKQRVHSFMLNVDKHVEAMQKTMLERYGASNARQVTQFLEKSKQTCLEKYGKESFTQTEEFKKKTIKTTRERYGTDWYTQTDEYRKKADATLLEKYGTTNVSKSKYFLESRINNPEKVSELIKFRDNPEEYIRSNYPEEPPTLLQLSEACGVRDSSIGYIIDQHNLRHLIKGDYSRMEDEVFSFLSEHIDKSGIQRNTFKIITPYELDIYIPSYNLAIECDPTWTHNSTISIFDSKPLDSKYHKMKTDMCEAKGIRLIHLFGYDWVNHKDTCKSIILNSLNKTPNRYYARKLKLLEVSGKQAFEFLQENHRQGGVYCKVNLGLFDSDRLVAVMCFSKLRHTIGTGTDDTSKCWELVRFCNLNYTTVVGGASKLLKYFINMYNPYEIRSFSDRAHTTGNLYIQLGFSQLRVSDPGYMWVDLKTDHAYARYNAQKQNIKQFLHDDTIDLSDTEVNIMSSHGYVQVFDSGTITWQLFPNIKVKEVA